MIIKEFEHMLDAIPVKSSKCWDYLQPRFVPATQSYAWRCHKICRRTVDFDIRKEACLGVAFRRRWTVFICLADLYEVIDSLIALHKIDKEQVLRAQEKNAMSVVDSCKERMLPWQII